MKVLLMNTSDIDGGAARAAYRLYKGLQKKNLNTHMLVQEKTSDDKTVLAPKIKLLQGIARARISVETLPLKLYPERDKTIFSLQWLPDRLISNVAQLNPDIINLHWISGAFVQIETIRKFNFPMVWTLHDMWPFTGGCHYSGECDRYTKSCGICPHLKSDKSWDLSHWVWQRKSKAWRNIDITIVTPSSWLAKCAVSSSLFKNLRIEVIPNGLDTQIYRPIDRQLARQLLNLPQEKQIILFGSVQATSDQRKGFYLLQPALQELSRSGWKDKLEAVIFGASSPESSTDFPFKAHYLGTIRDDLSLAIVYSAADIFVLPSTQDNLPNTLIEAMSCGTPCVAFNIGGISDIIEHQKNGYLAEPFNIKDLAQGMTWILENNERYQKLSYRAREKVEKEFSSEVQANKYLSLFNEISIKKNIS